MGAPKGHPPYGNPNPWTDQDDATLTAANQAGESLHATAAKMGRSKSALSRASKRLGLTWDRAATKTATAAIVADARSRRAGLRLRALTAAESGYDTLEAQTYKRIFKGAYGAEEERTIDFIPPSERRDLAASIAQHVAIESRLAAVDDDGGVATAKSMLGRLALDIGGELAMDLRTKLDLTAPDRTDV